MTTRYEFIAHLDDSGDSIGPEGFDGGYINGHAYGELRAIDLSTGQIIERTFTGKHRAEGQEAALTLLLNGDISQPGEGYIADDALRYQKTVVGDPAYDPSIARYSHVVEISYTEYTSTLDRIDVHKNYSQQYSGDYTILGGVGLSTNCIDYLQDLYFTAGQDGHVGDLFSTTELNSTKFAGRYMLEARGAYLVGDTFLDVKEFLLGTVNDAKSVWDIAAESVWDIFGNLFQNEDADIDPPTTATNYFSITNSVGTVEEQFREALSSDFQNGVVENGGNFQIYMDAFTLNGDGFFNVAPSFVLSNGIRPGAGVASGFDFSYYTTTALSNPWGSLTFQPFSAPGGYFSSQLADLYAGLSNYQTLSTNFLNIDPLILDLDGDGVELQNFAEAGVLFNMDDDEYLEQTGWTTGDDGFLVHDKNGDGKINDVSEMLSEYYAPNLRNGLEALKTLDSNDDDVFNASDTAYSQLRVWQDVDGNGQTSASELKTLSELGITAIDLSGVPGAGEIISGNEIQMRTTMTRNGYSEDVAAVNLLVNPLGHEWETLSNGIQFTAESGLISYSVDTANGTTVDVAALGVNSAYGNVGDDTLIGDAGTNWLGGAAGSDTFQAGAGDDVLLIDADDVQANIDGGDGFDVVQVIGDKGVIFNLSEANVELANGGRGQIS